jgi:hypothetical protein
MAQPKKRPQIESLLEQSAEKWRTCEGTGERDLLRLVVLRELLHGLHAEKSRLLSQGMHDDATSIRAIEARIEELRNCKPLEGDLHELLSKEIKLRKRTRLLPDAIFGSLEREKLERYDRIWEAALASEAVAQGWRVWALEAWVEISKVDEWNRRLIEQLWPHGIVLYVESGGSQNQNAWLGRWVCILHPKFRTPSEISLGFSNWPGTQSSPSWRLLFSPKSF